MAQLVLVKVIHNVTTNIRVSPSTEVMRAAQALSSELGNAHINPKLKQE